MPVPFSLLRAAPRAVVAAFAVLVFAAPSAASARVAPKAAPKSAPQAAPNVNDLRPALRALKAAKVTSGLHPVHTLADGSRLAVELADGKTLAWRLLAARGTPEGIIHFDRVPNPKDKRQCALLLARGAFTTEYVIDCAYAPAGP